MGNNPQNQEQQAWVHWEYTPDEWARLDQMDLGPIRQRYWLTLALGMVIPVLLLVLAPFFWGGESLFWVAPLVLVLVLVLFFVVLPSNDYRQAMKRHQARQDPVHPHRVTLSSQGIWGLGPFFPFTGTGVQEHEISVQLNKVWLTAQPTTLHFQVEHLKLKANPSGGAVNVEKIPVPETIHLLVPAGHDSEAEQVAQRFRTEVIEARDLALKRFRDQQVNPPEPR